MHIAARNLPLYLPDLPETARQIISIIPAKDAVRLIRAMHGERLYFRRALRDDPSMHAAYVKLAPVIGDEHARALIREWRGDVLEVPNCGTAIRRAVARWIRQQYDAGEPIQRLCLTTGYSRRWIFALLKRPDTAPQGAAQAAAAAQLALF